MRRSPCTKEAVLLPFAWENKEGYSVCRVSGTPIVCASDACSQTLIPADPTLRIAALTKAKGRPRLFDFKPWKHFIQAFTAAAISTTVLTRRTASPAAICQASRHAPSTQERFLLLALPGIPNKRDLIGNLDMQTR